MNKTRSDTIRIIFCHVANEVYALDMSWVQSVRRVDGMRRNVDAKILAGQETLFSNQAYDPIGWLPEGEADLAVYSLASMLAQSSHNYSPFAESGPGRQLQRVIVLNPPDTGLKCDMPWGLLVDEVSRVAHVSAESIVPLAPIAINEFKEIFLGVIRMEEKFILSLRPDSLYCHALGVPASNGRNRPDLVEHSSAEFPRVFKTDTITKDVAIQSDPTMDTGDPGLNVRGRILIFSVSSEAILDPPISFGLSISQITEIVEPRSVVPVPGAPNYVLGIINWRDQAVPLIDLAVRLGIEPKKGIIGDGAERLVIARDKVNGNSNAATEYYSGSRLQSTPSGGLIALWIKPDVRVRKLPLEHQTCKRSLSVDQSAVRGIVQIGDETLVIPDIGRILSPGV